MRVSRLGRTTGMLLAVLSCGLALATGAEGQTVIYVNAAAQLGGNGQSWATAYTDLQQALDRAETIPETTRNVEIWIAQGVYRPSKTRLPLLNEPRTAAFSIPNFTVLIGGFQGDELTSTESLPNQHLVTLSGDLANNDGPPIDPDTFPNRADNVFNVVVIAAGGSTRDGKSNITGCTITGGDGTTAPIGFQEGGGVFISESTAALTDCTIIRNRSFGGGGVGVRQTGLPKALDLNRCKFLGNHATVDSGALRIVTGDNGVSAWVNWRISQCLIVNNTAYDIAGLYASYGASIEQTTIANNRAEHDYGGAYLSNSSGGLGNRMFACIHYGNTAPHIFPGLYVPYGLQFSSYSLIDGPDPLFRDPDGPDNIRGTPDDDFSLNAGSPAIDKWIDTPGRWMRDLADGFAPADGNGNGTAEFDAGPYEYDAHPFSPIIRVKTVGAGRQDGSTWNDAVGGLQAALARSTLYVGAYQQIWIAAGTYKPSAPLTQGGSRSVSFQLQNNLAIYGGFNGTETLLSQRNIAANPTILSGDLNGDDNGDLNVQDNAYHVVVPSFGQQSNTGALDGFTITGGNANGSGTNSLGGGFFAQSMGYLPAIRNCKFSRNRASASGGAVVIDDSPASFAACTFVDNTTGYDGGAVLVDHSASVRFDRCSFVGNIAAQVGGALEAANHADAVLTWCDVRRNTANLRGGGLAADYNAGSVEAINTTIVGNISPTGAAVECLNQGRFYLDSSLIAGNYAIDAPAIYIGPGSPVACVGVMRNCSIVGNRGVRWAGVLVEGLSNSTSVTVQNCLLWGNQSGNDFGQDQQFFRFGGSEPYTISNCSIQNWTGALGGTGNDGLNPLFIRMPSPGVDGAWGSADDDYGDLRLGSGSPAVDSGNSGVVSADIYDINANGITTESLPLDLLGFPRFVDDPAVPNTGVGSPPVDRGCYESQVNCLTCPGPREWRSPLGGEFDFAGNWSPSVPQTTHDTLFNLPATYSVSFATTGPVTNRSATIRDGDVILALSGNTYSLTSGVDPSLVVGDTANQPATLQIMDGRVNAVECRVGSTAGSIGTIKVRGDGNAATPSARLATTEGLCVGCQGQGTLSITGGARVSCLYGFLGEQSGATGQVSISGAGSRLDAPFFLAIDNGNVNVSNGGTLATGTFGAIYLFPNGSISGDGTVNGHVVNFGGIAPGNSPGTLTINGNYDQVGTLDNLGDVSGKLIAQASGAGAGQFDKLVVNGTATLGGGLSLSLLNNYVPGASDQLQVVSATGGLAKPFDVMFFPSLDNTAAATKYFRAAYSGLRGPGAGSVTVNLGNLGTSPAFNDPSQYLLDNPPNSVASGDLNGDGLPDVAITIPDAADPTGTTGAVVILINQGGVGVNWQGFAPHLPGNPTTIPPIPVGINPKAAVIAKLDGAAGAATHLIVANAGSNSLSMLKFVSGAMQTVATQATDAEPVGLAATDFTGLGNRSDIVVVACGGGSGAATGSMTLLGNTTAGGTVSFTRRNVPAPQGHKPVNPRPFNPDQDKDIDLAVVMVATDGSADILAVYANGLNPGAPTPVPDLFNTIGPAGTFGVGAGPVQALSGKLAPPSVTNPAGKNEDLITVNNGGNSISVVVNTNTVQDVPSFAPAVDYSFDVTGTTAAQPRSGVIADLDGSGTLDVAVVANNPSGTNRVLKMLRNDSTTTLGVTQVAFAQMPDLASGSKPIAVVSGDMDADGQVDLVTINSTSGRDTPNTLQFVRNALPSPASSVGACCNGAGCVLQQAAQCASPGQRFAGTGTTCNVPGNARVPCCKGDFEQNGSLAVSDIFAFLNAWFAGSLRADTDDSGSLAVADIFAFLNAWFAGC